MKEDEDKCNIVSIIISAKVADILFLNEFEDIIFL